MKIGEFDFVFCGRPACTARDASAKMMTYRHVRLGREWKGTQMSQGKPDGFRKSRGRGLPLLRMGGMVVLIASCTPVSDVTQGRPIVATAWKSEGDMFLQTTVIYEMNERQTLAVAHLTISEDVFENGFFGEPGSNAPVHLCGLGRISSNG
ncbi:MAG: hypothetical protein IIC51_09715 [Planctomycetes bacterium]|nr:hypothetical protein [Planctomycetota bacterium]